MKVLMFGWDFNSENTSGLGTACRNIVQGLNAEKVDVTYILPNSKKEVKKKRLELVSVDDTLVEEVVEKYTEEHWEKVSYLKLGTALIPYVSPQEFTEWKKKVVSKERKKLIEQKVTKQVLKEIEFTDPASGNPLFDEIAKYAILSGEISKDQSYDVIHAHDWMSFKSAMLAKELSGKPFVAHVHSTEYDRNFLNPNKEIIDEERFGLQKADLVVVVSEFLKEILTDKYGIEPSKIKVVYNSLKKKAIPFSQKPNEEKNIAFIGRFVDSKGVQFFLDVARELKNSSGEYKFHLIGNGPLWGNIKEKVDSMNLGKIVKIHGLISQRRVANLFKKMDLIFLPSITEPFGMAAYEGVLSGIPVITTKTAGISEIFKSIIQVEYWDTFNNVQLIKKFLENPALAEKYVTKCQDEVGHRSWKDTSQELLQAYEELTDKSLLV